MLCFEDMICAHSKECKTFHVGFFGGKVNSKKIFLLQDIVQFYKKDIENFGVFQFTKTFIVFVYFSFYISNTKPIWWEGSKAESFKHRLPKCI